MNETQRKTLKSTLEVAVDDILENASAALLYRCIKTAPQRILGKHPNQNPYFCQDINQIVQEFSHVAEDTLKFAVRIREAYFGMTPAIHFQVAGLGILYDENIRGVPFGLDRLGETPSQMIIQKEMEKYIKKRIAKAENKAKAAEIAVVLPAALYQATATTTSTSTASMNQSHASLPRQQIIHAPVSSAQNSRIATYLNYRSDNEIARQLQMDLLAQDFDQLLAISLQQEEYQHDSRASSRENLPRLWG